MAAAAAAGESKAQISSVISVDAEKLVCATPPAPRKVLHGDGTAEDVHLLLSTDNVVYIDIGYDYTYYDQPPSRRWCPRAAPSAAARRSR